jgi:2-keto-4-pentenoate hydratase
VRTLTDDEISDAALALAQAEEKRIAIEPLTGHYGPIPVEDAYRIQSINVDQRVTSGERIVGVKAGLTSKAMQDLLGVDQPDFGRLFASMQLSPGEDVNLAELIAPRVEAEIAFLLGLTRCSRRSNG